MQQTWMFEWNNKFMILIEGDISSMYTFAHNVILE